MAQQRLHPDFQDDLTHLLNKHSLDSAANTPDFILAGMLTEHYESYRRARAWQSQWEKSDDAG